MSGSNLGRMVGLEYWMPFVACDPPTRSVESLVLEVRMHKVWIAVLLCLSTVSLDAQSTERGRFRVSGATRSTAMVGNVDLGSAVGRTKAIAVSVSGQTGYFIVDGLEFGPTVAFDFTGYKSAKGEKASTYSVAVGIHGAYFFQTHSSVVPFVQLSGFHASLRVEDRKGFIFGNVDEPDNILRDRAYFGVEPAVGIEWFVTHILAAEASAFLTYSDYYIQYGLSLGLSAFL